MQQKAEFTKTCTWLSEVSNTIIIKLNINSRKEISSRLEELSSVSKKSALKKKI